MTFRVTMNSSPMCLECHRLLALRPVGDGKNVYVETIADAQCSDHCLVEHAGKRYRAPAFELEELPST